MTRGQWFKLVCTVLYAGLVGGAFVYARLNPPPAAEPVPHSKAVVTIEAGHQITAGDLVSADQDKLVGRYALSKVEKGKEIAVKNVSDLKPNTASPAAVAVTFTIPRLSNANSLPEREFQVCLAGKVVAQAKPVATNCEEQSCRIVLLLNKGQELSLADAPKAAIMSGTDRCGP